VFMAIWGNAVAHAHAYVHSQRKVDLVLKSWYMGFIALLGFCLFLGSRGTAWLPFCMFLVFYYF
jgi:hypothetical protein